MEYRIAIVEDQPAERELLAGYIKTYFEQREDSLAQLTVYASGEEFLENYPQKLDLVFMDIDMGTLSGIETAKRLRRFDENVQILFVTRMIQYALEGYAVDAADFMVKPLTCDSFSSHMDHILWKIRRMAPQTLRIRQGRDEVHCQVSEITWLEALSKRTYIHRAGGDPIVCSVPLNSFEEQLGCGFFRCHHAYIVNMSRIERITATDVYVLGTAIPVSKHRRKEFLQAMASWQGRMF